MIIILTDIYNFIKEYIACALIFSAIISGCYLCYSMRMLKRKSLDLKQCAKYAVFSQYAYLVMGVTILSRQPDSNYVVTLKPFATIHMNRDAIKFALENIIMFIPLGILVPITLKNCYSLRKIGLIGFLCSCGIEMLQWITKRGRLELDDLILNTFGAFLGGVIFILIKRNVLR